VACLVGRNGAGKTTTLRTIMGYLAPRAGTVRFRGRDLAGLPTAAIAQLGLAFAPEDGGIFGDLTVAENIEIATWTRPSARPAEARIALAYSLFPGLRRYARRKGSQLSGGERKMLSIARALALDPDLLLLDEPFEGLAPALVPELSEGIRAVAALGRAVLLAESNIHHVPEYAARLYVIERGEVLFAGRPAEVYGDAQVLRVIGGAP
jgi:branched-chain amino acid transport system ATP-binding protein